MVTRGVTDVFQVVVFTTRTHAALGSGSAGIITLVEPKEHILELVHPGVVNNKVGSLWGTRELLATT